MAIEITMADRIQNRTAPRDPNDKTELNADNVMLILDKILNGLYRLKMPVWTISTRPANPEAGEYGFNSQLNQREWFDGVEWRND